MRDQQGDHRRQGDLEPEIVEDEEVRESHGDNAAQDDGDHLDARDAVLAGDDSPLSPGVPQVRDGR